MGEDNFWAIASIVVRPPTYVAVSTTPFAVAASPAGKAAVPPSPCAQSVRSTSANFVLRMNASFTISNESFCVYVQPPR